MTAEVSDAAISHQATAIKCRTSAARADIAKARLLLESAMQNARIAALEASQGGTPETKIATALGVNRMTVRRWLGKL